MGDIPITDSLIKEFLEKMVYKPLGLFEEWEQFKASKQPKRWEIVAYCGKSGRPCYLNTEDNSGRVWNADRSGFICKGDISHPDVKIHSVRRLSDNEVFAIGDRVTYTPVAKYTWIIDHFKESSTDKGKMLVFSKYEANVEALDNDLAKVNSPLFVTLDGKEIFEGDLYYWVDKEYATVQWRGKKANADSGKIKDMLYFSTKEAAEQWVHMNKSVISRQHLIEALKDVVPGEFTNHLIWGRIEWQINH